MTVSSVTRSLSCSMWLVVLFLAAGQSLRAEEQCLREAWQAYNRQQHKLAAEKAEVCIDEFEFAAKRQQKKLSESGAALPLTGSPPGGPKGEVATKIFSQGLLNDVAAAFFVKGRSLEYLYRKEGQEKLKTEAIEALGEAVKLKHARVFDPQGWFWSPSEGASDRLKRLQR